MKGPADINISLDMTPKHSWKPWGILNKRMNYLISILFWKVTPCHVENREVREKAKTSLELC